MTEVFHLGALELDVPARRLRIAGEEMPVQPLVLDFLAYLFRNGDRAVSKAELLDALWPGINVTEASLQRVASLGRGLLRGAGIEAALQSVPRFGYRLSVNGEESADVAPATGGFRAARRAFDAHLWSDAVAAFAEADQAGPLAPADLERWALAAECTGRPHEAITPLMRAVSGYAGAGDRASAVNPALALARIHLERGELAVAKGWLGRAGDLVADAAGSRGYGLWCWMGCRLANADGDFEKALDLADRAYRIGRETGDPVVESLGLVYRGFMEVSLGDTAKGVADQDAAFALGLSSGVDPIVGGILYCNILWSARNLGDWSRANQWSLNYDRWCLSWGMADLTGSCRLHRAEVLGVHGTLAEAEARIVAAIGQLQSDAPWATGDAHRVLGDIRLAAGDFGRAGEAYRAAYATGWDPQPGLALLQLAEGDGDAACAGLARSLAMRSWSSAQRRGVILATFAKVAARVGRAERARAALAELDADPERWTTPSIRALALEARAELLGAHGDLAGAAVALQEACVLWSAAEAAVGMAETRLALASLLVRLGDRAGAAMELSAAETIATRIRSSWLAQRCADGRALISEQTKA